MWDRILKKFRAKNLVTPYLFKKDTFAHGLNFVEKLFCKSRQYVVDTPYTTIYFKYIKKIAEPIESS